MPNKAKRKLPVDSQDTSTVAKKKSPNKPDDVPPTKSAKQSAKAKKSPPNSSRSGNKQDAPKVKTKATGVGIMKVGKCCPRRCVHELHGVSSIDFGKAPARRYSQAPIVVTPSVANIQPDIKPHSGNTSLHDEPTVVKIKTNRLKKAKRGIKNEKNVLKKVKLENTNLSNASVQGKSTVVKPETLRSPVKKVKRDIENEKSVSKKIKPEKATVSKVRVKSEMPDKIKKPIIKKIEDSSSSESEWEDVAEVDSPDIDDYKPEIPEGGVEITLEQPNMVRRRVKKEFDMMAYIRLQINRAKKDAQLVLHQVHLLCLVARGLYVNEILNSDELKSLSLSLIPPEFFVKGKKLNEEFLQKVVDWFCKTFVLDTRFKPHSKVYESEEMMCEFFQHQKTPFKSSYNMMFVCIVRTLGFNVRMCCSFYPVSYKPVDLLKKDKPSKSAEDTPESISEDAGASSSKSKDVAVKKTAQKKNAKVKVPSKTVVAAKKSHQNTNETGRKKSLRKSSNKPSYVFGDDATGNTDDDDDDFVVVEKGDSSDDNEKVSKAKKQRTLPSKKPKPKNRKILSSDSSTSSDQETSPDAGIRCWIEIFLKSTEKWICVDCCNNIFNKPYKIEEVANQPLTYVLAFDNKSYMKDVTKRYCSQWMTQTRKLRVDPEWWEDSVEPFRPPNTKQDKDEESQMEATLLRKPIPSKIGDFKNHPLYALKRHLLKFQAIYPPDAPTVGFLRSEPIYARECVHSLHSRETWLKEARLVRIGEEPYKIVKARPKWDKVSFSFKTDLPLHLFGLWQTEEYMPPIAWNGKVPRNEYGNVELFKACMLPIGTVHLRNAGLNRVAKKLGIDCSPAVVGFDGHCGSIHPVFDGFIVCEEFKDTLLEAWEEEQRNIRKREEEKREKRIYGNWKKLIKGVLIRERIKTKYAVT